MNETNSITSTNAVGNVVDSIRDLGFEGLLNYFTNLEAIHYVTFFINLVILIFGRQIINHLSVQTVGAAPVRTKPRKKARRAPDSRFFAPRSRKVSFRVVA